MEEEDGMDESAPSFSPRVLSLILIRTVLIASDEETIIDDVCSTLIHLGSSCPLTGFQELRSILVVPLPVGCFLLVRSSLFYVAFQIPLCRLFRLFLILAILERCSTFPTTIAIASTYHGNPKASAAR
jgi:hypothetical protein